MSGRPAIPRPADGDIDIAYKLEIGATVTFVLAAIVVGLRVVGRVMYARLGPDDYAMLMAIVCALCSTVIEYLATHWGLGRHAYYLSPEQRSKQQYYSYIAQAFCVFAITFAKVGICLTNIRVIKGAQRKRLQYMRLLCWFILVSVICINLLCVIMFWATCLPAAKSWDRAIPGYCMSPLVAISFVLLQGSYSAFSDYTLCVIPISYIKDLHVSKRKKIILCIIMGLGLITGIFATIRTVESSVGVTGPVYDISFISVEGLMWSAMERNFAILLGSVPSLRILEAPAKAFATRNFSKLRSQSSGPRSNDYEMKNNESEGSGLTTLQAPSQQYLPKHITTQLHYTHTVSQSDHPVPPIQHRNQM